MPACMSACMCMHIYVTFFHTFGSEFIVFQSSVTSYVSDHYNHSKTIKSEVFLQSLEVWSDRAPPPISPHRPSPIAPPPRSFSSAYQELLLPASLSQQPLEMFPHQGFLRKLCPHCCHPLIFPLTQWQLPVCTVI